MNIFYIGSSGALSLLPFETLLDSPHTVVAVGVHRPVMLEHKIIALENASLVLAAEQQGIDIVDLAEPVEEIVSCLEALSIDLILMSCFPRRLSSRLTSISPLGSFNLHPSLLPAYRGPEPLFWQMAAAASTGISWHRVSDTLDAGAIIAQKPVPLDDGLSYHEINQQLASHGAALMRQLLPHIEAGNLDEIEQEPAKASYFPYPQTQDFKVDRGLSARQAFNFMRATQVFNQPYRVESETDAFLLDRALDYDNNLQLDAFMVQRNRLYIPFSEGVLIGEFTDRISL